MTRFKPDRAWYIPQGSVRVADKLSDAVAYIYTNGRGKPAAAVFFGKQAKPVEHYCYKDEARREQRIRQLFESRRAHDARMKKEREDAKAAGPGLEVGDILNTNWGYDQTNIEFFEVIAVNGKMVTLREIAQEREGTGWEQGKCVPQSGQYVGEPIRRLARNGAVSIDDVRRAHKWGTRVAGVVVGEALDWSSYH